MNQKGLSLIEVVIYIALIAIALPAFTFFVVHVLEKQERLSSRILTQQTTASVFEDLRFELQHAQAIDITSSTLSSDSSALVFRDKEGVMTTIDLVQDTFSIPGTTREIGRLRITQSGNSHWITSSDASVSVFRIEPVRNGAGTLTGLNLNLTVGPHVTDTVAQQARAIETQTSIWIPSYVTEL